MLRDRSAGWVGVDRGAGATKIAQLRRTGRGVAVEAAAVTPRWAEPVGAPELPDAQCCRREIDAIRALVGRWRGRRAAAVGSMRDATLATSDDGLDAAACRDSWPDGDADTYTLTAPADQVDALCDGLHAAGLRCDVVDGAPLAIARALALAPGGRSSEIVAGLDWGAASATFVAARAGHAVYARKLSDAGFSAVVASASDALGLTAGETETLILREGVAPATAGVAGLIADAVTQAADGVVGELRRTLNHLGAKRRTPPPTRLWVLGVGGAADGLAEQIGERVGVPAAPWRPEGIEVPTTTGAPACLFGQAIALSALAWESRGA